MHQDPFPDPGPDGSPLPPAAAGSGPEEGPAEDGPGVGEGLYVCLPAEQVTLAGFAQNGEADTMAPGPLLAAIVDTVTGEDGAGLGGCSDDQLMGIISAARRMAARAEWTSMAAIAEYAARHTGSRPADEFAPEELAFELHLTPLSAGEQMGYASTVAARLPRTFAALAAGQVHPVHVRIIEDETRVLSAEDAAEADAVLSGQAPGMTFGELRAAARKLVLKLDPEAARKRKEAARSEAQVRRFREASGNAGMVARELPSDEVLASWQHVEQRALDLRAAGMPGTLQELRVQAYLDLLQERDSRDQLPERDRRDQPAAPGPAGEAGGETGGETGAAGVPDQPPPDSDPRGGADPDDPGPATALASPADPVPMGTAAPMAPATVPAVQAAPAGTAPGAPAAPVLARAWPRWSPSPSPGLPSKANPTRRAKPTGSARWTATTPATWPPPRPATPGPGGASPH